MKKQTNPNIKAHLLRGAFYLLLLSAVGVIPFALSSAINLPNHPPKFPGAQNDAAFDANGRESASSAAASAIPRKTTLTFSDRVAYQRAIEDVYWRHRTWPQANADAKPQLDKMMSQAQIEKKVEDYLRNSQALEDYWQKPITPDQLQAEMDRMAQNTKQPQVLLEIFQSLGDDPLVIAECLARPLLAHRLITELNDVDHVKPTTVAWLKEPIVKQTANYTLPAISSPSIACTDDTWTPTSITNAPDGRLRHTAVWTGVEMIVWGGDDCTGVVLNTGARYNPSTDSWTAIAATGAPDAREEHTAVWTGSEMIVWGGWDDTTTYFNTGGRYNPGTDSWTATSITNAPDGRYRHTAVWTGSEMIVWGGVDGVPTTFNTGGRYNPSTDSWIATSTTNAPTARRQHTAVWTSSQMIVWGGAGPGGPFNTGGQYNPGMDSWTATSTANAPAGRIAPTSVWTGSEMIVWGGTPDFSTYLNTGGRYNPGTDSWTATSITNAPDGRYRHTAVWADSVMIIWGGTDSISYFNTGGRYNPGADSWTATSTTSAPDVRAYHTAVWTGSQMIVWGGTPDLSTCLNTGGRYCAAAQTPTPTPTPTPSGRPIPTPRPRPTPAPR